MYLNCINNSFSSLLYNQKVRTHSKMVKQRKQKIPKTRAQKKKRVQKHPLTIDNKISIKKLANQKEIIADFALVCTQDDREVMSIPVFRKDKLDYTPGFCLPDEFTQSFRSQQSMLHQFRFSSQCNQIDVQNIKQPKPSSRNSYCTICKTRFDDYKQHITLESHLTKMRSSLYNSYIEQFCRDKKLQKFLSHEENTQSVNVSDCNLGSTVIFRDQFKMEKKTSGNYNSKESKQALYQKVKEEIKDAKDKDEVSPNQSNQIFDVLV